MRCDERRFVCVLDSIVVSILACHVRDPGFDSRSGDTFDVQEYICSHAPHWQTMRDRCYVTPILFVIYDLRNVHRKVGGPSSSTFGAGAD